MYTTLTSFDNLLNELTRQPLTTPTRTYGTFEVDVLEDLEAGLFDLVHRQAAVLLVRVAQV